MIVPASALPHCNGRSGSYMDRWKRKVAFVDRLGRAMWVVALSRIPLCEVHVHHRAALAAQDRRMLRAAATWVQ